MRVRSPSSVGKARSSSPTVNDARHAWRECDRSVVGIVAPPPPAPAKAKGCVGGRKYTACSSKSIRDPTTGRDTVCPCCCCRCCRCSGRTRTGRTVKAPRGRGEDDPRRPRAIGPLAFAEEVRNRAGTAHGIKGEEGKEGKKRGEREKMRKRKNGRHGKVEEKDCTEVGD